MLDTNEKREPRSDVTEKIPGERCGMAGVEQRRAVNGAVPS